jgi:hypothetical protein
MGGLDRTNLPAAGRHGDADAKGVMIDVGFAS